MRRAHRHRDLHKHVPPRQPLGPDLLYRQRAWEQGGGGWAVQPPVDKSASSAACPERHHIQAGLRLAVQPFGWPQPSDGPASWLAGCPQSCRALRLTLAVRLHKLLRQADGLEAQRAAQRRGCVVHDAAVGQGAGASSRSELPSSCDATNIAGKCSPASAANPAGCSVASHAHHAAACSPHAALQRLHVAHKRLNDLHHLE